MCLLSPGKEFSYWGLVALKEELPLRENRRFLSTRDSGKQSRNFICLLWELDVYAILHFNDGVDGNFFFSGHF